MKFLRCDALCPRSGEHGYFLVVNDRYLGNRFLLWSLHMKRILPVAAAQRNGPHIVWHPLAVLGC
jgi:hypothetical protein